MQRMRAYERELPGGGCVAIEITRRRSVGRRRYEGRLVVERRTELRNNGHAPPEIALVAGQTIDTVVRQLLPTALSNACIAAALLRFDRGHP